jgi:hypothetical protein
MMGRTFRKGDERGFALVTVILFSVVLTLVGLSIVTLSTTEEKIAYNNELEGKTFYVSEAGLENQIADLEEISSDRHIPTPNELLSISQVPPDFDGYTYTEYGVERDGEAFLRSITVGPYAGLSDLSVRHLLSARPRGLSRSNHDSGWPVTRKWQPSSGEQRGSLSRGCRDGRGGHHYRAERPW